MVEQSCTEQVKCSGMRQEKEKKKKRKRACSEKEHKNTHLFAKVPMKGSICVT